MDEPPNAETAAARSYRRMRPVFTGSMGEVTAMQSSLAAQGFETFIEQEMTKTLDPLVTGGNVFQLTLSAPEEQASTIESALREMREGGSAAAERDDEEPSSARAGPTRSELEAIGRRIRWCAIEALLAPVGLMLGVRYLEGARGLDPKPGRHRLTLLSLLLCLVEFGMLLWAVWFVTVTLTG